MSTSVLLFTGIGVLLFVSGALRVRRCSKLPLPPGPRKLPLVGNLLDIPATFQWETYARWSKEYNSDIIHLSLPPGKSMIVLNSWEATEALLEKRSAIYSDRDDFPMINDLMGWDFDVSTMKYGDKWRIQRRLFNQVFNLKASRKYEPDELLGSRKLLKRILSAPDAFLDHFRQMTGELILSLTYGIDVLPSNDPYIAMAEKALHGFSIAAVPGLYLVDTFPLLKYIPTWFPGAGFKRQAREWRKLTRGMLELPFSETKRRMEMGTATSSYTADYLTALSEDPAGVFYQEYDVQATAGIMFATGADTTVSALGTFVLAMLANPEAQKRAQAEIDYVTLGEALPTFADRESLPYVSALVKEVLRWKNTAPFGMPHRLMVEDEFRGYRLPAGSLVIGNTWALLHDEKVYPDPHAFKPERFLLDGRLNPAVRDPEAAFGYGRRQCPGKHLATSSIWITVASVLAALDISKAVDPHCAGRVIEPSYEYVSGMVCAPLPFECEIKARSRKAVGLIEAVDFETGGV